MDFSQINERERQFYSRDFSEMNKLLGRIRQCLISGEKLSISDLNLEGILDFNPQLTFTYITIFEAFKKPLRWGSCRATLEDTLNRNIQQIRKNKNFETYNIENDEISRILIEYVIEETPTRIENIKTSTFCADRFEPGITGLKLNFEDNLFVYMPTEAWLQSQMSLNAALNAIIRKTRIKEVSNIISERIDYFKKIGYELFIIKSRAFITYKKEILPLYRGTTLNSYTPESIKDIALAGADWILKYQKDDGRFLYYYDAKEDNYIDHEHPKAPADKLYYNDLRHCGGIITLIRAYQLTKDAKYLDCAKKGIDFITTITKEHNVDEEIAAYVHYNRKGKLGGTGLILVAMMKYRCETGDKSYDEFIKKYVRHILSRICDSGEMLGYYIHPQYQKGKPLLNMTDEERRAMFSFYYPGEALLGLALFVNYFKDDDTLRIKVIDKSKLALDWIVDERPKIYADLFTALPSDSWLMQAIEEFATAKDFQKDNYINFVYKDAQTMMDKMYQKDDSPYIDYEGGYFYNHGDHYYPDGARSEGLVSAYYLAKKLANKDYASKLLEACRKAALSQMILFNTDKNNYAHKNPEKSKGGIRFKATRQWVRVDSIQHVACSYFRLYFAEKNIDVL
ncbi:MAG: protein containing Six-hairpin glycosidase-like domain protein [Cyanobacteria bacterium SIG26]|nr:protein containing Six-hairpin glycosidase-like domain protein [Cyanobacteria bacterium SIG26]